MAKPSTHPAQDRWTSERRSPAAVGILSKLVVAGMLLAALAAPAAAFGVDCHVQNRTLLPRLAPYDIWHQSDHPDLLYKRTAIGSLHPRQAAVGAPQAEAVPKGLKIAFVGDVTLKADSQRVYSLIKAEKPDFLAIAGDLDYVDAPDKFIGILDKNLPNTPTMVVIGNHDLNKWDGSKGYGALVTARYKRLGMDKFCTGEVGIKSTCTFKGVTIAGSGVGTRGKDHEKFLGQALAAAPGPVKFCMWHKNQRKLQPGNKKDEVGFGAYEACRKNGAPVITGHNHGYARSFLLSDMTKPTVANNNGNQLDVRPGQIWSAVVGTGGRPLASAGPNAKAKYWVKSFTKESKNAAFGAMFCVFNADGNSPNKAQCTQKTSSGKIFDQFTTTFNGGAAPGGGGGGGNAGKPPSSGGKKKSGSGGKKPGSGGKKPRVKEEDVAQASSGVAQNATNSTSVAKRSVRPLTCRPVHLEVTAAESPATQNEAGLLDLKRFSHTLSFNLDVPSHAKVSHAFLQVYGKSEVKPSQNHLLHINSGGVQVPWLLDEEEVEQHEVWVSPDIRQVVESHQAQRIHANRNGVAASSRLSLTLRPAYNAALEARGAIPDEVQVVGIDPSKCFSPTLAVVMEVCE